MLLFTASGDTLGDRKLENSEGIGEKEEEKVEFGGFQGRGSGDSKDAICRAWTRRSYPSVRNTGTRIVYKHFIRFIMAAGSQLMQTQARYSWVTVGARGYMGLSTEAKGKALKSRVRPGRGLQGVFDANSVSIMLGEQTPEK